MRFLTIIGSAAVICFLFLRVLSKVVELPCGEETAAKIGLQGRK